MIIKFLRVYNTSGLLIKSWEEDYELSATGVTYLIYAMPSDTNRIIYGIELSGVTHYYDEYNLGTSQNQLYYFDNEYVNVLYCDGKRENSITTTKQIITNAKKINVVEIKVQHKLQQNTGLKISEDKLFNIGKSPFIFDISGTTVKNYIVEDTSFEGFTTRSFGDRNTVLNLKNIKEDKRFTAVENNFYA